MFVYFFKEGFSSRFKIGHAQDVEKRRRELQTGNSYRLSTFHVIETDDETACESFFHQRLVSRRVVEGGWEFFEMDSEDHMRQTIGMFEAMVRRLEEAHQAIAPFSCQQSGEAMLDAKEDDQKLLHRLLELREEKAYLEFECDLIESKLKQRIGSNAGISGIATWKSEARFDELDFKARDPEGYQAILERYPCIDTTTWSTEREEEYKGFRTTHCTYIRKFRIQKSN